MIIVYSAIGAFFILSIFAGIIRSVSETIKRFFISFFSLAAGIFLTKATIPFITNTVIKIINKPNINEQLSDYLNKNSSSVSRFLNFSGALIAPFIFVLYFILIRFILKLIFLRLLKRFKILKKDNFIVAKLIGIILSVATFTVTISALSTPIIYTVNSAQTLSSSIKMPDIISEISSDLSSETAQIITVIPEKMIIPQITEIVDKNGNKTTVGQAIEVFSQNIKDASDIVETVSSSDFLSNIVMHITNNGQSDLPFSLDFINFDLDSESLSNALKKCGLTETDNLYKSLMSLAE